MCERLIKVGTACRCKAYVPSFVMATSQQVNIDYESTEEKWNNMEKEFYR